MSKTKLPQTIDVVHQVLGRTQLRVKFSKVSIGELGFEVVDMVVSNLGGLHDITHRPISNVNLVNFYEQAPVDVVTNKVESG